MYCYPCSYAIAFCYTYCGALTRTHAFADTCPISQPDTQSYSVAHRGTYALSYSSSDASPDASAYRVSLQRTFRCSYTNAHASAYSCSNAGTHGRSIG